MKEKRKIRSTMLSLAMIFVLVGIYIPSRVSAEVVDKTAIFNGDVAFHNNDNILHKEGIININESGSGKGASIATEDTGGEIDIVTNEAGENKSVPEEISKASGNSGSSDIGVGASAATPIGDKKITIESSVNQINNNINKIPKTGNLSTPVLKKGLTLGTVGVNTIAQEFPNSNIANEVLYEINYNTSGSYTVDDILTQNMALSVTDLNLSALFLDDTDTDTGTSLGNLKDFTNLISLDLSQNMLTKIPDLSGLTKLQSLIFYQNFLKTLIEKDLSGLTSLNTLQLSNNQLSTLPNLSGLTNLTMLAVSNNQLSTLPNLSGLTNLTTLVVSNNQLSTLPDLSGLNNLQTLILGDNKLRVLPDLSKIVNLTTLVANNNQLIDIPGLSGAAKLSYIALAGQVYIGKGADIIIGSDEEIGIPIVKEINDTSFVDFLGYNYVLKFEGGVAKDITGDVIVNKNGIIIPGKDVNLIGKYTLHILGLSALSGSSLSSGYTGDYTYTFAVESAPVPAPTPAPMPVATTNGVIVASTSKGGIRKLPNTGAREEMYIGILMLLLGFGAFVIRKKVIEKNKSN